MKEPRINKLDMGQRHMLRLLKRDANIVGWVKISDVIFPYIEKLPPELVEVNDNVARLTPLGLIIIEWAIGSYE